jgi:lipopolysaccharide transport system permease protein
MRKIHYYSEVLFYKAWAELKAECGRTWAGALWWFADPLASILIYYIAFGLILKRGGTGFVAFLCVGIVIWRWFQGTVLRGASSIISEKPLMEKVYIPKILFPAICLVADLLKFSIMLILLLVFLWCSGEAPSIAYLGLPLVSAIQFVFMAVLVGLLSAIVPFMPDLRNMLAHGLHLMFFISGVFFSVDRLDEPLRRLVKLNPMAGFISSYRRILIDSQWPDWEYLLIVLGVSLLAGIGVLNLHRRLDRLFPKYG